MPSLPSLPFDPLIAIAVVFATACTDAIYVLFTNAVVKRRRFPAAAWSSVWYMLGSFAVITYTHHWIYVIFAAAGSVHRRLCDHDLPPSRPRLSAAAGRLRRGGIHDRHGNSAFSRRRDLELGADAEMAPA